MSQMSEEQISDVMEVFLLFDNRGDNKLAVSQLGDCLRSLNLNPTESEIRKCGYVNNTDARIPFEVFLPIYQTIQRSQESHNADEFCEGLKMFDKEMNGFINSAELRHVLSSLGEKLTDEECNQLFQGQEDAQGNVNYEEFVKTVMAG